MSAVVPSTKNPTERNPSDKHGGAQPENRQPGNRQPENQPAKLPTKLPDQQAEKRLQLLQLAKEVRQLEKNGGFAHRASPDAISTGCQGMDALLPAGGYEAGCIVEYLRSSPACGANHLALAAAACAMRAAEGYLVVVDPQRAIYPPALVCHGIDLQRVIFVHPETADDLLWAIDQGLRTSAVAAVVAEWHFVDDRSARRLQLAAESGKTLGILVRGLAARRSPTWAEVQWVVRSAAAPVAQSPGLHDLASSTVSTAGIVRRSSGNRRLFVQLARVRGGRAGALLRVDIDAVTGLMQANQVDGRERNRHDQDSRHATRAVRLATELADPASASRRAQTG